MKRLQLAMTAMAILICASTAKACPACGQQNLLEGLPYILGIKMLIGMLLFCYWLDAVRYLLVFIPTILFSFFIGSYVLLPMLFMPMLQAGPGGTVLLIVLWTGLVSAIDCLAVRTVSLKPYFKRPGAQSKNVPGWTYAVYIALFALPALWSFAN